MHSTMTTCGRLLSLAGGILLGLAWPGHALYALPAVQRTVLPNQLVLLVSEEHSLPLVTCHLLIDAGSWRDPQGMAGLASLTAKGLLLGTAHHPGTALHDALDTIGASLQGAAERDYTTLSLQVLTQYLDKGLDLFLEVLSQPTFPAQELQQEVERALAALQAAEDEPEEVAAKAFQEALFLSGPYKYPVEGRRQSLPALTQEAVQRFYHTYYRPNIAILTVVGDITAETVAAKLLPRLTAWAVGEIPPLSVTTTVAPAPQTVMIDRPITQATIMLGQAGMRRSDADFYALTVMNYILGGGGFSSRLMEEIRNQRGLAYAVDSSVVAGKYPGSVQVVLQTKNASAQDAMTLVQAQMERMRTAMVSDSELQEAKQYLMGNFPLRLETQAKLAQFLSQVEYYGLGLEYPQRYPALIEAVTREDVLRVARVYLRPDSRIIVVVANLQETGLQ